MLVAFESVDVSAAIFMAMFTELNFLFLEGGGDLRSECLWMLTVTLQSCVAFKLHLILVRT